MSNARDQKALELARDVVSRMYGGAQLQACIQVAILAGMEWVRPKDGTDALVARPPVTPEQLASFIDQMAENPKGGKMAAIAYKHCARLIRERLS